VSREVLFLLTICLLDTLTSALFFHSGMASEANPLLRPFVEAGVAWFVGAKTLTFAPALLGAEWGIRRRRQFYAPLLRWVGALYVGIYALCVAGQFFTH